MSATWTSTVATSSPRYCFDGFDHLDADLLGERLDRVAELDHQRDGDGRAVAEDFDGRARLVQLVHAFGLAGDPGDDLGRRRRRPPWCCRDCPRRNGLRPLRSLRRPRPASAASVSSATARRFPPRTRVLAVGDCLGRDLSSSSSSATASSATASSDSSSLDSTASTASSSTSSASSVPVVSSESSASSPSPRRLRSRRSSRRRRPRPRWWCPRPARPSRGWWPPRSRGGGAVAVAF